jgi:pimeloyl-ACP methyl ester carboxylesterase
MADIDTAVRTETGRKVAYAQTGQPDGAPVVYCHGFPGSRLDLHQPFSQAALNGSGVRVIGIDRFGIIAYSAGGPYAIACALAYPER